MAPMAPSLQQRADALAAPRGLPASPRIWTRRNGCPPDPSRARWQATLQSTWAHDAPRASCAFEGKQFRCGRVGPDGCLRHFGDLGLAVIGIAVISAWTFRSFGDCCLVWPKPKAKGLRPAGAGEAEVKAGVRRWFVLQRRRNKQFRLLPQQQAGGADQQQGH